jgi:hypothetical protein
VQVVQDEAGSRVERASLAIAVVIVAEVQADSTQEMDSVVVASTAGIITQVMLTFSTINNIQMMLEVAARLETEQARKSKSLPCFEKFKHS